MLRVNGTIGWAGAALLGAMLALPVAAQTSGGIKGRVIGVDGKPLAKAQLTLTRTDIPATYTIKTDKNGNYGYYTLPLGTYDVSLKLPDGHVIQVGRGVATHGGDPTEVDADLKQRAAVQAGDAAPPGMSKEQAAEYEKKVKEQEEQNKKVGQLNTLLQQNKQLTDAKQYDQAIAVMEQAVALDQTHDVLYANLADDYTDAKQYDKAADAYQKAIALKPANAGYLINLGTVLSKEGKVDEANAEFAKAAAMDPTQAKMAMYNSGVVLLNQGNMDGAAAAFDKLLAIDPTNADAWYYKGICLLGNAQTDAKTGKLIAPPGAEDALKKSIQLAPTGPNAVNAKAALQTIGGGQ
ncbi:MAG: tetratricopeptide repeat protein [Terriglobales bacterium]